VYGEEIELENSGMMPCGWLWQSSVGSGVLRLGLEWSSAVRKSKQSSKGDPNGNRLLSN